MTKSLTAATTLGAICGAAISAAIYGGLGLWIAGTPGLICGLVLAAGFAIKGLQVQLQYLEQAEAFERTYRALENELRQPLP